MRILLFSYYNPLGRGGFEKQARGLVKTLINQGHQVACLTIANPHEAADLKAKLEVLPLFNLGAWVISYEEKSYSPKAKFLFWLSSNPAKFLAHQHPDLLHDIEKSFSEICEELKIDVIHCLGLRTAYFLPEKLRAPIILDLVDSFTQHKKRTIKYCLKTRSISNLILSIIDFLKTSRIEQSILSTYLGFPIAVVSVRDAETFRQLCPAAKVFVTSHPVDIDLLDRANAIADHKLTEKHPVIVFYGFMEQLWNIDALKFLINEILPEIYRKYPNLKLAVTGLNLPDEVFSLARQHAWIDLVSDVEDIGLFLSSATLTCWPFRYGSGFKNKILESMVFGKSVVTTTLGAEALMEQQKQGLLIADTALELTQSIVYLLENPRDRLRLGTMNRQIALEEFSWDKKAQDYLHLYAMAQESFAAIS